MAPKNDPRLMLDVLAKRAPESAMVAAELCLLSRDRVREERYSKDRTEEELTNVDAAALDALRAAETEAEAAIDVDTAARLEQHERDRRARADERRTLRDVVDPDQLRHSEDPDELLRLVADARAIGGDVVGEEAARLAETRLRILARAPGPHEPDTVEWAARRQAAFSAVCALSSSRRGVDRADIAGRAEQRKREVRDTVAAVAAAIGLGEQYKRHTLRATAPRQPASATKPSLVFGSFWESGRAQFVRELTEKQRT